MTDSSTIPGRVLRWYARHGRNLPWRKTGDPYALWISEVMLQQTRVETVIPYYQRFISRFPTVRALAEAPLEDVLKVWENLGYYGRARNLHRAAGIVVRETGGRIPGTHVGLRRLPGVGAYTASALLSIAFGEKVPALDGNVRRVISRLFSVRTTLGNPATLKKIDEIAATLVPAKDPGAFNQGLMDLGAAVCTPRNPDCGACPLADLCLATMEGLEKALPVMTKRAPLPHRDVVAAFIRDKDARLLIVQRHAQGLLGGLWKLPGGERRPDETMEQALVRTVQEELGIGIRVGKAISKVKHAYTHFRITLHAFHCSRPRREPHALGCAHLLWAGPAALGRLPFSRAYRKVLEARSFP